MEKPNGNRKVPIGRALNGVLGRYSDLMAPFNHGAALRGARIRQAFGCIRGVMVVLALLMAGWMVFDLMYLPRTVSIPLVIGRLAVVGVLIGMLVYTPRGVQGNKRMTRLWSIGFGVIAAMGVFYVYALVILVHQPPDAIPSAVLTTYMMVPVLMVVILGMFPLTFLEAAIGATIPFGLVLFTAVGINADGIWLENLGLQERTLFMMALLALIMVSSGAQVRMIGRITHDMDHDPLTGCLTRRAGEARLGEITQENPRSFILMFMDLDRFSEVNNLFGHEWGDRVLVQATEHMRQNVRSSDTVIRWGGEEFVILLMGSGHEGVVSVLQRIAESGGLGVRPDGKQITTSVGIALYPEDASQWDEVVRMADERMYRAKRHGGNAVCPGPEASGTLRAEGEHPVASLADFSAI